MNFIFLSFRQYKMMTCEFTDATTEKTSVINDYNDSSEKQYNINSDVKTAASHVSFYPNEDEFMFLNELNKE